MVRLDSFLEYEQPTKYIVKSEFYSDDYKIPVLTAGQSFVLGHTNETENIFTNVPVIIFDDFTTSIQYVDFPFKVKSSAMKILKPTEKSDIRFCYYLLKNIKINSDTHKRYWISEYAPKQIKNITIDEQKEISKKLDVIVDSVSCIDKILVDLDNLIYSKYDSLMKNDSNIEMKKLIDVVEFIDYRGKTPTKTEKGIPLITAKNVKKDYFSVEPREFIAEESYEERMTRGIPKVGDVLFTTEAPLGNVCLIPDLKEKFSVGQRIITMHPKDNLKSEYLKYTLLSDKVQSDIYKKSTGSTVKGIKSKFLKEILIPIISYEKQTEFSNFLNKIENIKNILKVQKQDLYKLFDIKNRELFAEVLLDE